jgi:hypothetical protein
MARQAEEIDKPDWWDDVEEANRDDLTVSNETTREYIKIERDGWDEPKGAWFDINDIPWLQKKSVLSDVIDAREDGSGEMHLDQYYRQMLDNMVEDSSVDIKKMNTFLAGVNEETGSRLEALVPEPSERAITEAEEGKSDEQSEETGPDQEAGEA